MSESKPTDPGKLRLIRDHLYDVLLGESSACPQAFIGAACDAWQEVVGASFGEVWLHNEYVGSWELLHSTYSNPQQLPIEFPDINPDKTKPIVDFACDSNSPTFIEDLAQVRSYEGQSYSVSNKPQFQKHGYPSFICIPLLSSPVSNISPIEDNGKAPPGIEIRACMCMHFKNREQPIAHPSKSIQLMSRLTSLALRRSYESEQREILLSLNGITETHSADHLKSPREVRTAYLDDLLSLIRNYMNAAGVSIFYREADPAYISCVATTGLLDRNHQPVPPSKLHACRYHEDDRRWTAECYRTARTKVATPEDTAIHEWRFTERAFNYDGKRKHAVGSVLCPIQALHPQTVHPERPALGVIRCSGLKNAFSTAYGTVNAVGRQTLGLIAQQAAPFLESLAGRIRREDTISQLKHDLASPLTMIWNTADSIETTTQATDSARRIKFLDLMDIKFSAELAMTMLPNFNYDPGFVKDEDFCPSEVLLGRDILSHLRHLVQHFASHESGMPIRYTGLDKIPPLYVDKLLIQRALFNVILNAVKYGKKQSDIHIQALEGPSCFNVLIENQGIGVPPEDQELIFELGYRCNNAKLIKRGTGYGLYVTQQAMVRHGGEVVVASLDNPTIFELRFPKTLLEWGWWQI